MYKILRLVPDYFSLFLSFPILYIPAWICNDTLNWENIPTVWSPRIRQLPKLGKRGKYYRVLINKDFENFRILHYQRSVRKLYSNRRSNILTSQLWYEVGRGGILRPINLNNNTEWESVPPSLSAFDTGYGK